MSANVSSPAVLGNLYRWDLDRTYLDSDIRSMRGMLRTALEPASAKRAIPGATALIRALGARSEDRVEIVSGSPEQMRGVLSEKLALDGVRVDAMYLKDQVANLRAGRLRAMKEQIGYKLPLLLGTSRAWHGEWLFGDDTEADPVVYALYARALDGTLDVDTLSRVMKRWQVDREGQRRIHEALQSIPTHRVEGVFIHVDRGVPVDTYAPLGSRVIPVHSWFQAAVVLWSRGIVDADALREVARQAELSPHAIVGLLQDLRRRVPTSRAEAACAVTVGEASPWTARVAAISAQGAPTGDRPDCETYTERLMRLRP